MTEAQTASGNSEIAPAGVPVAVLPAPTAQRNAPQAVIGAGVASLQVEDPPSTAAVQPATSPGAVVAPDRVSSAPTVASTAQTAATVAPATSAATQATTAIGGAERPVTPAQSGAVSSQATTLTGSTASESKAERLAALPEPAPQRPEPAEVLPAETGSIGAISALERARFAAILDFVRSYDGGDCFAAIPTLSEATATLALDVFGETTQRLDRFRRGLESEAGIIPQAVLKPMSASQCTALTFVRSLPIYPQLGVVMELDSRTIRSGEELAGQVRLQRGTHNHLLLVDDE
ncbi:MAG: hypothetical protein AAFY60_21135, partial [Myxococcota bacterium]